MAYGCRVLLCSTRTTRLKLPRPIKALISYLAVTRGSNLALYLATFFLCGSAGSGWPLAGRGDWLTFAAAWLWPWGDGEPVFSPRHFWWSFYRHQSDAALPFWLGQVGHQWVALGGLCSSCTPSHQNPSFLVPAAHPQLPGNIQLVHGAVPHRKTPRRDTSRPTVSYHSKQQPRIALNPVSVKFARVNLKKKY